MEQEDEKRGNNNILPKRQLEIFTKTCCNFATAKRSGTSRNRDAYD